MPGLKTWAQGLGELLEQWAQHAWMEMPAEAHHGLKPTSAVRALEEDEQDFYSPSHCNQYGNPILSSKALVGPCV